MNDYIIKMQSQSNIGIRRAAKLYKALSLTYKNLSGLIKYKWAYYFYYRSYNNYIYLLFHPKRISCSCFQNSTIIDSITVHPKEFYKVYQIVESWLREGNE